MDFHVCLSSRLQNHGLISTKILHTFFWGFPVLSLDSLPCILCSKLSSLLGSCLPTVLLRTSAGERQALNLLGLRKHRETGDRKVFLRPFLQPRGSAASAFLTIATKFGYFQSPVAGYKFTKQWLTERELEPTCSSSVTGTDEGQGCAYWVTLQQETDSSCEL